MSKEIILAFLGYPEFRVCIALVMLAAISIIAAWRAPNADGTTPKFPLFWSGLVVSLVFGLSASPLIAASATGLFSVATAGVAIWTGTATLDAFTRWSRWSLPFFAAFLIGIPCGIVVRVNDLLSFHSKNLPFELNRMGFTSDQITKVMSHLSDSPEKIKQVNREPDTASRSNLISTTIIASLKEQIDLVKKNEPSDTSKQLALLRNGGNEKVVELIGMLDSLFDEDSVKMRVLQAIPDPN